MRVMAALRTSAIEGLSVANAAVLDKLVDSNISPELLEVRIDADASSGHPARRAMNG